MPARAGAAGTAMARLAQRLRKEMRRRETMTLILRICLEERIK
jgi:hypothetical protein